MYLVHARLRGPAGTLLPDSVVTMVRSCAHIADGLECVVVHADARPHPVLGLYLIAEDLEDAESRAAGMCRRTVDRYPLMAGWELVDAQVPLIGPFYERLLT